MHSILLFLLHSLLLLAYLAISIETCLLLFFFHLFVIFNASHIKLNDTLEALLMDFPWTRQRYVNRRLKLKPKLNKQNSARIPRLPRNPLINLLSAFVFELIGKTIKRFLGICIMELFSCAKYRTGIVS